jgi:hypothetical protein
MKRSKIANVVGAARVIRNGAPTKRNTSTRRIWS